MRRSKATSRCLVATSEYSLNRGFKSCFVIPLLLQSLYKALLLITKPKPESEAYRLNGEILLHHAHIWGCSII
jgi:hypothetical protein